jgi:hypothetical protein
MTREGQLNADARRKLKQINHLIGLLRPALEDVLERFKEPVIVDCGAGKAYLGFLIHELFLRSAGRGRLWSVETRPELTAASEALAKSIGAERLSFVTAPIAGAPVPERAHLVVALHACDTATDDALSLGLSRRADHIAVVPCCQAEVARQLGERPPPDPALASLAARPLHRRELGAVLTNALRALALEGQGYRVTVTELVGWEHSLKNELILAKRVQAYDAAAIARLEALTAASGVQLHRLTGFTQQSCQDGEKSQSQGGTGV